jgi:hypothetical protein
MTDIATPTQHTLPASLMKLIQSTAANPEFTESERYEVAILVAFGYCFWDQQTAVDPRLVRIPSQQWNDICQALIDGVPGTANAVSMGMNWMNQGPSSFEEN